MKLQDSPPEERFRKEVRTWLRDTVPTLPDPPDPTDWAGRRAYDTRWQGMLHDAGYAGINWPKEYGGAGATPGEHLVFLEESARAGAPDVGVNFVGLLHGGPTLIMEGRPDQQAEHLPKILQGESIPSHLRVGLYHDPHIKCPDGCSIDVDSIHVSPG